jgi:hypothetical protein
MAFENLKQIAEAMGFSSLQLEFLILVKEHGVGSLSRLAAQHNLPISVGVAAKREFIDLMVQGAQMFAPRGTVVNAARIATKGD